MAKNETGINESDERAIHDDLRMNRRTVIKNNEELFEKIDVLQSQIRLTGLVLSAMTNLNNMTIDRIKKSMLT